MPIGVNDIHFRASTTSGSTGNSTAPGAAGTSLGKYMTNADITGGSAENLFDVVTGDQNAAGQVDYQAMFVYNAHGTLSWLAPVAWLSSEVAGGTSMSIGWDTTAASVNNSASAQALTIVSKTTAPAGVTFSAPGSKGAAASSPGNLAAGYCKALWVRRTAANTVAVDNDGGTIRVEGDTSA